MEGDRSFLSFAFFKIIYAFMRLWAKEWKGQDKVDTVLDVYFIPLYCATVLYYLAYSTYLLYMNHNENV